VETPPTGYDNVEALPQAPLYNPTVISPNTIEVSVPARLMWSSVLISMHMSPAAL